VQETHKAKSGHYRQEQRKDAHRTAQMAQKKRKVHKNPHIPAKKCAQGANSGIKPYMFIRISAERKQGIREK
jgi:hypothetical protein